MIIINIRLQLMDARTDDTTDPLTVPVPYNEAVGARYSVGTLITPLTSNRMVRLNVGNVDCTYKVHGVRKCCWYS
jgi:hypothetical protein